MGGCVFTFLKTLIFVSLSLSLFHCEWIKSNEDQLNIHRQAQKSFVELNACRLILITSVGQDALGNKFVCVTKKSRNSFASDALPNSQVKRGQLEGMLTIERSNVEHTLWKVGKGKRQWDEMRGSSRMKNLIRQTTKPVECSRNHRSLGFLE